jgi:hypothetical protein
MKYCCLGLDFLASDVATALGLSFRATRGILTHQGFLVILACFTLLFQKLKDSLNVAGVCAVENSWQHLAETK